MGQVNRIPSGFLDLVGAQSQGKTPPLYSDSLSPVVDLRELYLGQTLSGISSSINHTTVGNSIEFEVPSTETWLLRAVASNELMSLTTQRSQWEWVVVNPSRGVTGNAAITLVSFFTSPVLTVVAINNFATSAFSLPVPMSLVGGTKIRALLSQRDTGALRASRNTLLFNRLTN